MKEYMPDSWRSILRHNNLDSFDALWSLESGWFEPPNRRRGGWSGVSRCELELPEGGTVGVFLKRQENHTTRTPLHPFGVSTFVREMQNVLRFRDAGIPALEPVYFAVRKSHGCLRAILCTRALDGFQPLEALVAHWQSAGWPARETRRRLIEPLADAMARMHAQKIQHNCFYPKHVFVRQDGNGFEVRIIDLEKAKVKLVRRNAVVRDLDTLNRHAPFWSRSDRLCFFLAYLGLERLTPQAKALWQDIARRKRSKQHT